VNYFAIYDFLILFQPSDNSDPGRPGPTPSPPPPEVDVARVTRLQAVVMVQGMDTNFLRRINATFYHRQTRQLIMEAFDSGILGEDDMRRLIVSAEARNMRISTLIQLILRSFQD
jgi:hypothetical protein